VRIHPASINSGLEVWRPEEGEPEYAALAFYDEITRGESFLCEWPFLVGPLPSC
jgi:hypothetical protein